MTIFMCNKNTFPEQYKGFDVISVEPIPDCDSEGIYLRHRKTGLEVFHLLNSDEENLFAFSFRTPIKNSTGAAHILEHSVFCGSEKFPLKEPFTNLMNQSVNTFLNAMTYSDKTVYPASSMVKADYYNLLDVYADAVFFPLLKNEAFMQEAHRIELNEKGDFEIQGVVYNEMKGEYSSFESVAETKILRSLFPDTNYSFDSGGDPLEILNFTYEDFKAFHKQFYTPQNCLLFLYGNIPTEEQLDFLQEKLLSRLEKKYEGNSSRADLSCFEKIEIPSPFSHPVYLKETAPATGATGSTVTMNWLCGDTSDLNSFVECVFIAEVLTCHDGSPLTKALLESALGDDIAPSNGCHNFARKCMLSFGLHGVQEKNAEKVFEIITAVLKSICENGIDHNSIDAALMSVEFANREIVRVDGPYSLVLLNRALNGWNYGKSPASTLLYRAAFERLRENVRADKNYTVNLIKKYLVENKNASYSVVSPSKSYLKERAQKERETIKAISKSFKSREKKERLANQLAEFHSYQQKRETEAEIACIPRLQLSDLKITTEHIVTEESVVKCGENAIPLFKNTEATNGISYIEVWIPVDALSADDYMYLSLYSYCATNMGWKGKSWAECAEEEAVSTGGLFCRLYSATSAKTERAQKAKERIARINAYDRDWIVFSVKTFTPKIECALDLLLSCISATDFTDVKRLHNLTLEFKSSLKASVIPHGNRLAALRARRAKSRSLSAEEIWYGLTQVFAIDKICNEGMEALSARFEAIAKTLKTSGALIHVVSDSENMQKVEERLSGFAEKCAFVPLSPSVHNGENFLLEKTILPGQSRFETNERFSFSSSVGFAAAAIDSSCFGDEENACEIVLAHYLSGTSLWERIRTTGGAYGAYASSINVPGIFMLSTYRDPSPEKSLDTFLECISDAAHTVIKDDELCRMIAGTYGEEQQPHSPRARGNRGFLHVLDCIDEDDKIEKVKGILCVSPEKLRNAAASILKNAKSLKSVVICDKSRKSQKSTGIIIDLPL